MKRYLTASVLMLATALGIAQVTITDGKGGSIVLPNGSTITIPGATITAPTTTPPPVVTPPPVTGLPAGVTKATTLPAEYKQCSTEWAKCTYNGDAPVYYGQPGNFWVKSGLRGTFDCMNETFGGDPSLNVAKFCYTQQTTSTLPPVTTPPPVSSGAGTVQEPFAAGSFWKAPIKSTARYSDRNDPRVRSLMLTGAFYPNTKTWTQWVNIAGSNCQRVTVNVSSQWITGNSNPAAALPGKVSICMPPGAKRDPGIQGGTDATWKYNRTADNHAIFVDPDGRTAHEFWQFHNTQANGSGEWRAVSYARSDLINGLGYNYTNLAGQKLGGSPEVYGWGATRAYGGSALGGLIRINEVISGKINHKVSIALPAAIQRHNPANPMEGAIYPPATRPDTAGGMGVNQTIKHGQTFAIPKNVNIESLGLSAAGKALAYALQNYGMVVVDQAGGATFNVDGFAVADGNALAAAGADRARLWTLVVAVDNP